MTTAVQLPEYFGNLSVTEQQHISDESMSATNRLLRRMMTSTDTLKMLDDPVHQSIFSKMAAQRPSAVSQQRTRRNSARRMINLRHKPMPANGQHASVKQVSSSSVLSRHTAPSSLSMETTSASPRVKDAALSNRHNAQLLAVKKTSSNEEFINYRRNLMKLKYLRSYETRLMHIFQVPPSRYAAVKISGCENRKHVNNESATLRQTELTTDDQQQHWPASFFHDTSNTMEWTSKSSSVRMTGIQHYDRILHMLRASRNFQMAQAREQELTAVKRFVRQPRRQPAAQDVPKQRTEQQHQDQEAQRKRGDKRNEEKEDEKEGEQPAADEDRTASAVPPPPNTSRSGRLTATVPTTSIVIYLPNANLSSSSSAAADNGKQAKRSSLSQERSGSLMPTMSSKKLPADAGANKKKGIREEDCYKISYSIARDSLLVKRQNVEISEARRTVPIVFIGQQPIHITL